MLISWKYAPDVKSRIMTVVLVLVVVGLVGGIALARASTPHDPCPQAKEIEVDRPGLACPVVNDPSP